MRIIPARVGGDAPAPDPSPCSHALAAAALAACGGAGGEPDVRQRRHGRRHDDAARRPRARGRRRARRRRADPRARLRPARLRAAPERRARRRRTRRSSCAPAATSTSGSATCCATRGSDARTITVLDARAHAPRGDGEIDPHWWQDPRNAAIAVALIRDALIAADPAGRAAYAANADALPRRGCARSIARSPAACARIPASRRKLVTDHDALGYYADRYDIEVVGTVIPALLDAGAGIRRRRSRGSCARSARRACRTIFPESSVNPKLTRAIARDAGARSGRRCTPTRSARRARRARRTSASLRANTRALVRGFSGGRARCALPGSAAAPRSGSAVGVPGLQRRQRVDRRAARVPAGRRSTSRSAGGSRCATPVSPTLPIDLAGHDRRALLQRRALAQVHVDVVDVRAGAVDDEVVAGVAPRAG